MSRNGRSQAGQRGRVIAPGPRGYVRTPAGQRNIIEEGGRGGYRPAPEGYPCPTNEDMITAACRTGVPPLPTDPADLEAALEDYQYNGQIMASGWPRKVFEFPQVTRPPSAQTFRRIERVVLVPLTRTLIVEQAFPAKKSGRLLELFAIEIGGLGDAVTWDLRVEALGTDDGAGMIRRNPNRDESQLGNYGSRESFEKLQINVGQESRIRLFATAGAALTVQACIKGWLATVTGAGPVTTGYELP